MEEEVEGVGVEGGMVGAACRATLFGGLAAPVAPPVRLARSAVGRNAVRAASVFTILGPPTDATRLAPAA